MQWNNEKHGGFTDGDTPWLPVHPDYLTVNVEVPMFCSQYDLFQLFLIKQKCLCTLPCFDKLNLMYLFLVRSNKMIHLQLQHSSFTSD